MKHIELKKGKVAFFDKGYNDYKTFDKFTEHIKKIEDDFWNRRFKVYSRWKDKWWGSYQKNGYVSMYTGFRCSGIMRKNECINIPIQGSAFHCLLWSFIQVDKISREQNWKSRLIGQIHDAMVLDVHPDELDMVKTILYNLQVDAEYGIDETRDLLNENN